MTAHPREGGPSAAAGAAVRAALRQLRPSMHGLLAHTLATVRAVGLGCCGRGGQVVGRRLNHARAVAPRTQLAQRSIQLAAHHPDVRHLVPRLPRCRRLYSLQLQTG